MCDPGQNDLAAVGGVMPEELAGYRSAADLPYGWLSTFPDFHSIPSKTIREALVAYGGDVGEGQLKAWRESIPPLQSEVGEVLLRQDSARAYTTLLEYQLPYELRRPDVIFLAGKGIFVLEVKGKGRPERADIDQASAYRRDLKSYHAECLERPVHAALVLTHASGRLGFSSGVHVVGIDAVDELIQELDEPQAPPAISAEAFLADGSYCPAPTLVEAAREIAQAYELRWVHRAQPSIGPALEAITKIIHDAAANGERRLILVSGAPGAGKTLIGIKVAHERYLDDLALPRSDGRYRPPAMFLLAMGRWSRCSSTSCVT